MGGDAPGRDRLGKARGRRRGRLGPEGEDAPRVTGRWRRPCRRPLIPARTRNATRRVNATGPAAPDRAARPGPGSGGPSVMNRRGFLQSGLAGLSLPNLLALRGQAGAPPGRRADRAAGRLAPGRGEPPGDLRPQARRPGRDPRPVRVDRHEGRGRPDQRAAAGACPGGRQVLDPAVALAHRVLPPAGQPADVHGAPRAGAQAQARTPRPDVHRAPGAGRPGPPRPRLCRRQPDPVPRLGLSRPGLRAVRGPRRPERAGLLGPRDRRRQPGGGRPARGPEGARVALRRPPPRHRRHAAVGRLRCLPEAGVHAPDRPRGPAGLRHRTGGPAAPRPLRPQHLGPALPAGAGGWSRRASTSSRRAWTAPSAGGWATGTTTPSTTTSSTR